MFGIVINELGYKVEFIALNEDKSPQFYELSKGESIIEKDWQIANSMLKPKWDFDNEVWIETASEEEIEASKPPQIDICPEKTLEERLDEYESEVISAQIYITDLELQNLELTAMQNQMIDRLSALEEIINGK